MQLKYTHYVENAISLMISVKNQ